MYNQIKSKIKLIVIQIITSALSESLLLKLLKFDYM